MITPVILSGGFGTRLWPLSRRAYPKQFLPLVSEDSLFASTCRRLSGARFTAPIVVCNEEHRFLVAATVQEECALGAQILLEPKGCNTAAACAVATLQAMKESGDPLLLLAPSDHVIKDIEAFHSALAAATPAAEAGAIVTFGIKPTTAHTGYGYIEVTQSSGSLSEAFEVTAFHEKPETEIAAGYASSGRHYWNGGIFLFKASTMKRAFATEAAEIWRTCEEAFGAAHHDLDFIRLPMKYAEVESISLDCAILEKVKNIGCVALDVGWDDLGSWSSLMDVLPKDEAGNATHGDVIIRDSRNSLVYADNGCVALLGVEDAVVVTTCDATLVTTRERAQDVKSIVEELHRCHRPEANSHLKVYRPWGWYEQIAVGHRFQVKCIMVKAGGMLSLQSHMHRAEHWVVVTGTIEVTKGREVMMLTENQSTYIPLGEVHRLANRGKVDAYLIEVQSGAYLNEDDIIRHEDAYGRCEMPVAL